ncbi:MAG: response regulator transcription factor [Gemmatimonadaceae bacterium]|nr:response regulator transcription factor [Gemmatimonadaceae bacterium]
MSGAGAPHILIVEDSEDVVLALRLVMESAGHRVTTAMTVADAVQAGAADPVDVMLLDLTLPDGNGLDVLGQLEAAGRLPRHTIALTGRDEVEVRDRCLACGCGEVMVKPVPVRALIQRVGELVAAFP